MKLTTENVSSIVRDSLFKENEDTTTMIMVEGVKNTFGFNPVSIEKHKSEIEDMLSQLPDEFSKSGWSFLQACMRNDDVQWGDHRSIDELICLGLAIEKVSFCMPRELWAIFPGGMPYFVVK